MTDLIKFTTVIDPNILNKEIVIQNQETFLHYGDVMKLCKDKIKEVDEERKAHTDPLEKIKKDWIAEAKLITEPIQKYVDKIADERDRFYRIEQARINEENKRLEAEAIANAKPTDVDVVVPVVESIKTTKGQFATTTMIEKWTFEVTAPEEVDRLLCSPDDKKIQSLIDGGIREIKGVRVFNKFIQSSR